VKVRRDEGGGRILPGDNRPRGDRAAADQVSLFGSLNFSWIPLYCTHILQMTVCLLSYVLQKIQIAPTFRKVNTA